MDFRLALITFISTLAVPSVFGESGTLKFLAIGDMGGSPTYPFTTRIQLATSQQMDKVAEEERPAYIMALGDNFYEMGVKNVDDPRFQESYEDVYIGQFLQVPWYILAGNHDHYGNVSAEIVYSKVSKRWNFPNLYYLLSFTIPGTTDIIDIVMIDTVSLCGNTNFKILGDQPRGPANSVEAESQWDWIEQRLANSRASYLIVAGHFPVYSVAEHGPTLCLVDRLLPMLYKYKVNAYICGHDHNLQHLQTTFDDVTVNYIVTGSSNYVDASMKHQSSVPDHSLKFHWANAAELGGLTLLEVTTNNLNFTFIDSVGTRIYNSTIYPRNVQ